jgi:signal transduction histidine kinase
LPGWRMAGRIFAGRTSDPGVGLRATRAHSLLRRPTAPSPVLGIVVAAVFIVGQTVAVLLLKQVDPQEAFETLYLVGVVVVSTVWGVGLAMTTSVASALALAYFRNWPDRHFAPLNLENGIVIVVFLAVALSTNFVAGLARARAVEADQRRREANALATQQSALRRVATLVARESAPPEVFSEVATGLARCLDVPNTALCRFEPDGEATLLAARDQQQLTRKLVGTRFSLEGENILAMVLRTGRAARMDSHDNASGPAAARFRELGMRSAVGAPIIVGDRLWGAATVGSSRPGPLPADTEARVQDFADLVAIAIANTETRAQLSASRVRIVAAADDARRRLERDLHDGAQQRLITLGLKLRAAEAAVAPDQIDLETELSEAISDLLEASHELQEISRGIHPAILSQGGLAPALDTLAIRSPVPADLDLAINQPLSDLVEVAAYYVVAEALTNAAKHAHASQVTVSAKTHDHTLILSIDDDGIGGADAANGSGLTGLIDRVEALGGTMAISSRAGSGTSLLVKIPLDIQ